MLTFWGNINQKQTEVKKLLNCYQADTVTIYLPSCFLFKNYSLILF